MTNDKKDMLELIIPLVAKLGIEGALIVLNNIKNAKTIDDAITALEVSVGVTWADYKKQAT